MTILSINIPIYFLLFMIYSFLGWCLEVICKLIEDKKFINRGFLIGPYCPIYGCGSLLITLFLHKYTDDPVVLFVMAIFICGTLEYLTSFFMEKLYNARWWDYSQRKFNINGRICLGTIIPFGLFGLLIMYVLNPFFLKSINLLSQRWLDIIFWSILVIFIIDNIISGIVIRYIRKAGKTANIYSDSTEEITSKVKELLLNKSALHRRLLRAYPKLQALKIKVTEQTIKIKNKQKVLKQNIIHKNEVLKENLKSSFKDIKDFKDKKRRIENKLNKENFFFVQLISLFYDMCICIKIRFTYWSLLLLHNLNNYPYLNFL